MSGKQQKQPSKAAQIDTAKVSGWKWTGTIASTIVVAVVMVGLAFIPTGVFKADSVTGNVSAVAQKVSPKQVEIYCPSRMTLADAESYGDAEFQATEGNLATLTRFASFGSIFHSQLDAVNDAAQRDSLVIADSQQAHDGLAVASAKNMDQPAILDTRFLSMRQGDGSVGSIASNATKGDLQGISGATCRPIAVTQHLMAGGTQTGYSQRLNLVNPTEQATTVQVEVWGNKGEVTLNTNSELTVPAHGSSSMNLGAAAPGLDALYITVTSATAPIGASVSSIAMDGLNPRGSDFATALPEADKMNVIPLPEHNGTTDLILFSKENTEATLSWMTSKGIKESHKVQLQAGTVSRTELKDIPHNAHALRIETSVPVNAISYITQQGEDGQEDFALVAPNKDGSIAGAAIPDSYDTQLIVANAASKDTEVTFTSYDSDGHKLKDYETSIKAGSAIDIPMEKLGGSKVAALQSDSGNDSVHWGIALTKESLTEDKVAGISYLPSRSLTMPEQTIYARNDPLTVY